MDNSPSSLEFKRAGTMTRLGGREFWELHRRLGECYETDLRKAKGERTRSPQVTQVRHGTAPTPTISPIDQRLEAPRGSPYQLMPPTKHALSDRFGEESEELGDVDFGQLVNGRTDPAAPRTGSLSRGELMRTETSGVNDGSVSPTSLLAVPHECWLHRSHTAPTRGRRRSVTQGSASAALASRTAADLQQHLESTRCGVLWHFASTFTLSPTGHFRNFWDALGIFILIIDTIVLPVQFVNPSYFDDMVAVSFFENFELIYWFLDVILAFFTAYLHKGELVRDHRAIACHYLRTWFLPDSVVTVVDIVSTFSNGDNNEEGRASTRVLRLLRLLRVVRLGKLTRFASFLRDQFESEVAYTQFSLLLLIVGMCLLEHAIACGWFGIASYSTWENTWLKTSGQENDSFTLQYTSSLRWAYSQLGVGGTETEAVNETEGIYSVVVALISLITFSTIISSMTSLVSTLQGKRMEKTQQFGLLRRFLRVNKIQDGLAQRITRFLHFNYHERTANSEDPYILDFLSKSLQAELQLARYDDYLRREPFLQGMLNSSEVSLQEGQVVQTLASKAVSLHDFAEDDVIFCHGNRAVSSYLTLQGQVHYLQAGAEIQSPRKDTWICEMPLWTAWSHVGDLLCTGFGKVLVIDAEEFCQIISRASAVQVVAHKYAIRYVDDLNLATQASDLWINPERQVGKRRTSLGSVNLHGMWNRNILSVLPTVRQKVAPSLS